MGSGRGSRPDPGRLLPSQPLEFSCHRRGNCKCPAAGHPGGFDLLVGSDIILSSFELDTRNALPDTLSFSKFQPLGPHRPKSLNPKSDNARQTLSPSARTLNPRIYSETQQDKLFESCRALLSRSPDSRQRLSESCKYSFKGSYEGVSKVSSFGV